MISDANDVCIEGVIVFDPDTKEFDGKKVINFVIESTYRSAYGAVDPQLYDIAVWNNTADKYEEKIKKDVFVRVKGHLQAGKYKTDEKVIRTVKVCADNIQFEEQDEE
jgi:single-stranded DNA-binding protein